ncbi:MAG TPA: hypothetical protein VIA98_13700 [Allosphingosinicella sp.]
MSFLLLAAAALGACAAPAPPVGPPAVQAISTYEAARAAYHAALSLSATDFPPSCPSDASMARIEAARASLKMLGTNFYNRASARGDWTPPPMFMLKQRTCSEAGSFPAELERALQDFQVALARY